MMIPLTMPDIWPQRFLRPNSNFPLASRGRPYMSPEFGGYQRKFFISHNPEAWALADVVIDTAALRAVG